MSVSVEHTADPEDFLASERLEGLMYHTLINAGRIGIDGTVLPVTMTRSLHDLTRWSVGPTLPKTQVDDLLLPEHYEGSYITKEPDGTKVENHPDHSISSTLKSALTKDGDTVLPDDYMALYKSNIALLQAALRTNDHYNSRYSQDQFTDAIHLSAVTKPKRDIADTRVYVSAGIAASGILAGMLDRNAEFTHAKMWITNPGIKSQSIRKDTPLFETTTLKDLSSVVTQLREINESDELPVVQRGSHVGEPVPGLPGVYIGQTPEHTSFNGQMSKLLGDPIIDALRVMNLPTGAPVTREWLSLAARVARDKAIARAPQYGVDPTNHAFLAGQPKAEILAAIAS